MSALGQPASSSQKNHSSPASRRALSSFLLLLAAATGLEAGGHNATADAGIPIKITNSCPATIWPALATQEGRGPTTHGFEVAPKSSKELSVSQDWQGRVWARTNCSFNAKGTAASDGGRKACDTGDCDGVLDCIVNGNPPATLFEIALQSGANKTNSFYDISLVDGYNLPLSLTHLPPPRLPIPPNLTNPSCIATPPYSTAPSTNANSTYPTPRTQAQDLSRWCPFPLLLQPPPKPDGGAFPLPDDHITRPPFSPCLFPCAATGSDGDCCTGSHSTASTCSPGLYSYNAKRVCPNAYSFAYDDGKSTFSIPSGGGWEATFCPGGASSNILASFGEELGVVAGGEVTEEVWKVAREGKVGGVEGVAAAGGGGEGSLGALVVVVCVWVLFW
ncbi:hypothetical protein VE02_00953 [Pseudogymnoascus sp. 03VT05]|nr:hypothetical protein VE02_00953 [Pseudogymnoascus sp. 03VT05]